MFPPKKQKFGILLFQSPESEKETTEKDNDRGPQKDDTPQGQTHCIWQASQKGNLGLAVQEGHCIINHKRSHLANQSLQGEIMPH